MLSTMSARLFPVAVLVMTAALAAEDELKTIEARGLELQVPSSWKPVRVTSQFRIAEFDIPSQQAEAEGAEFVVYYFGGPTGGVRANVNRWIGQFHEQGRQVKMASGKCRDGRYIVADISGTWKKPDGPPIARKTIDKPGSRVVNVILIAKKREAEDYYFLKLSGPNEVVKKQAAVLRQTFGAKLADEKPFRLEDAPN